MRNNYFDSESLTARVRDEKDLLALTLHLLGYWPQDSLIFLPLDGQGVGPLLRVDLPDLGPRTQGAEGHGTSSSHPPRSDTFSPASLPSDPFQLAALSPEMAELDNFLTYCISLLLGRAQSDQPLERVCLLLAGQPRPSQSSPELDWLGWGSGLSEGQGSVNPLLDWAACCRTILESRLAAAGLGLLDFLIIDGPSLWALDLGRRNFSRVAQLEQVYQSPVFAECVAAGSVVESSFQADLERWRWNPLAGGRPSDLENWLAEAQQAEGKCQLAKQGRDASEAEQVYADLLVWEQVLGRTLNLLDSWDADGQGKPLAQGLREILPPSLAGFLASSLSSTVTLTYLVYQAASSLEEAGAALGELEQKMRDCLGEQGSGQPLLPDPLPAYFPVDFQLELPASWGSEESEQDQATGQLVELIAGRRFLAPRFDRLEALELVASLLETFAQPKAKTLALAAQAWVAWFWGSSSEALYLLEEGEDSFLCSHPLLLLEILASGQLPCWLGASAQLPARKHIKNRRFNPGPMGSEERKNMSY